MSNATPSLPAIDLRGSSSAGSEQSISPRKSNSNSIQDGRNSPRGSAGGPTPVVTIPALSSISTFTAAVDATSNMLKQLLPAALSPRSPTSPTAGRSPTAGSGGKCRWDSDKTIDSSCSACKHHPLQLSSYVCIIMIWPAMSVASLASRGEVLWSMVLGSG
jgi:hypothetical protein